MLNARKSMAGLALLAVAGLLAASGNPEDRFVEHSIIYALIRLHSPAPLLAALDDPNPQVRKASLIALDQMEGSPLRRQHLVSLLAEADGRLGGAVLWVAAHHPEWSSDIVDFLRAWLRAWLGKAELTAAQLKSIDRALLAFCPNPAMQQAIADVLGDPSTGSERGLFLLDAIDKCPVETLPPVIIARLGELAATGDAAVRQRVAALAGTRRLADLDGVWVGIATSASESDDLRTAALGALVSHRPRISESSFDFLVSLLKPDTEADLRLSVAQLLGKARLDANQSLALARDVLPRAGPLVLPALLDAFRDASDEKLGRAIVDSLLREPESVSPTAAERLARLLRDMPAGVRSTAEPLHAREEQSDESRARKLAELEPLLTAGGDLGRGRQIFFGKKAGCSSCHTIGDQGGDVGPDLTAVGAVRSGLDILEAIVFPNASFVPGHEVYRVTTARDVYTGVRGEGPPGVVVLISSPRDRTRIPRKDIISMEPSPVSLMPDGFAEDLSKSELTDLLAFLQAQKSRSLAAGGG